MNLQSVFSSIGGVLFIIAYIPYILAIKRGETKPAKTTWIIYSILDTTILMGMYFENSLNGQIIGATLGVWVVVIFALKYGTSGWTGLDKFCLGCAFVGIVLWQVFSNPIIGIIMSLIVGIIGSIPTFVSAWKDPSKEDKVAWTLFWISCIFTTVAIPMYDMANAAQPLSYLAIECTMMYLLFIRSHAK